MHYYSINIFIDFSSIAAAHSISWNVQVEKNLSNYPLKLWRGEIEGHRYVTQDMQYIHYMEVVSASSQCFATRRSAEVFYSRDTPDKSFAFSLQLST